MKQSKSHQRQRLKLILTAVGALIGGIALIALSTWMRPQPIAPQVRTATTTMPTSAPSAPIDPKRAAAQNLSGILMLFGLAGLLVAVVFVVLLVIDIRNSRPAWQTQQKYPRRR